MAEHPALPVGCGVTAKSSSPGCFLAGLAGATRSQQPPAGTIMNEWCVEAASTTVQAWQPAPEFTGCLGVTGPFDPLVRSSTDDWDEGRKMAPLLKLRGVT